MKSGTLRKIFAGVVVGTILVVKIFNRLDKLAAGLPERKAKELAQRQVEVEMAEARNLPKKVTLIVPPGKYKVYETNGRCFNWRIPTIDRREFKLAHVSVMIDGRWQSPEDPAREYSVDLPGVMIHFSREDQRRTTAFRFAVPPRTTKCPTDVTACNIIFTD